MPSAEQRHGEQPLPLLSDELRSSATTPERKEVLEAALKMAKELSNYCAENGVGTFRVTNENGSEVAWRANASH